jgi:hypothetical protein
MSHDGIGQLFLALFHTRNRGGKVNPLQSGIATHTNNFSPHVPRVEKSEEKLPNAVVSVDS